jgi:hypothetical protein
MAKAPHGILGEVIGKVGTVIGYVLKGQWIIRSLGKITKAPSKLQIFYRHKLPAVDAFLTPILDFIKVGMEPITVGTTWNFHNAAVHYNFAEAIVAEKDQFKIDFTKAVICKGKIEMQTDVQIVPTTTGIKFKWDGTFTGKGVKSTDQVMMLAYFTNKHKASFDSAGAKRSSGEDHLPIAAVDTGRLCHVYVSFISQDRKNVANNYYLGEFVGRIKN